MKDIPEKITIATTTLYNPNNPSDMIRTEIAKKLIRSSTGLGYKIVVVDGGSSDEILEEFEKSGALVKLQTKPGIGNSRREAIDYATGLKRDLVAWAEPEKGDYIQELWKTALPIIEGKADMVIPDRRPLSGYPVDQKYAEDLGNLFWKDLTGVDLDMWSGPRTWRRDLSIYFTEYNGEYGDKWDSTFIPVMNAVLDRKRVIGVKINYIHPPDQAKVEERDINFHRKRIHQLYDLTNALFEHWNKHHPNS